MRWNCGPTLAERKIARAGRRARRHADRFEWHVWYAWYKIRLWVVEGKNYHGQLLYKQGQECVIFEKVERRWRRDNYSDDRWEYREIAPLTTAAKEAQMEITEGEPGQG